MIVGELNRDWAGPGFHLRALSQVVQLHAAAAGRNLYWSVRAGQTHTAPTGVRADCTTHVAKVEIAAVGAGTQVAGTPTHLDTAGAGLDGRALDCAYVHFAATECHPCLPTDIVDVNVTTAAGECEVCAQVSSLHRAASG